MELTFVTKIRPKITSGFQNQPKAGLARKGVSPAGGGVDMVRSSYRNYSLFEKALSPLSLGAKLEQNTCTSQVRKVPKVISA
jgi:hypothetical protein